MCKRRRMAFGLIAAAWLLCAVSCGRFEAAMGADEETSLTAQAFSPLGEGEDDGKMLSTQGTEEGGRSSSPLGEGEGDGNLLLSQGTEEGGKSLSPLGEGEGDGKTLSAQGTEEGGRSLSPLGEGEGDENLPLSRNGEESGGSAPSAQDAGEKNRKVSVSSCGALSVDGTKLVDGNGNPVQLRGISTHGLSWYPEYVNKESVVPVS